MNSLSKIKNQCSDEDEMYKKYMVNKEVHLSKIKEENKLKNDIKKDEFSNINKRKLIFLIIFLLFIITTINFSFHII